jgi:hypothetical protein
MYKKMIFIALFIQLGTLDGSRAPFTEESSDSTVDDNQNAAVERAQAIEDSRRQALQAIEQTRLLLQQNDRHTLARLSPADRDIRRRGFEGLARRLDYLRTTNISGTQGRLANSLEQVRRRLDEMNGQDISPLVIPQRTSAQNLSQIFAQIPVIRAVGPAPIAQQPPRSLFHDQVAVAQGNGQPFTFTHGNEMNDDDSDIVSVTSSQVSIPSLDSSVDTATSEESSMID